MRSKTILSTAAFIVAFAASAAFANLFITETQTGWYIVRANNYTSCFKSRYNSPTADRICDLIRKDVSNESENGRKSYGNDEDGERPPFTDSAFPDYAEAVERYADASSGIKATDLPNDFQVEWRAHMKAWRDYSDFLNRMKKSSNRAALSGEELEAVDYFHGREIKRTWKTVLQNGADYGVNVY